MSKTQKRALLSSFAMLIVSAIVLSSATFAWFIAGDTASVTGIGASVAASSSIQVSKDNITWTNALTGADLSGVGTNSFPSNLRAVSTPATASMPFYEGQLLTDRTFSAASYTVAPADASGVVRFTFYIKSDAAVDVSLTGSDITGGATNATYVAVQVGTDATNASSQIPVLYSQSADSYRPLTGTGSGVDDNPENYVMDVDEFTNLGAPKNSAGIDTLADISLAAETPRQVIVHMWLEGQDTNCFTGTGGTAGSANLDLNFTKVE